MQFIEQKSRLLVGQAMSFIYYKKLIGKCLDGSQKRQKFITIFGFPAEKQQD